MFTNNFRRVGERGGCWKLRTFCLKFRILCSKLRHFVQNYNYFVKITNILLQITNIWFKIKNFLLQTTKKYIDKEPPWMMRQICVLQWEEIKTKNSGATHHFWGKRAQGQGWNKNILLFYFPYWPQSQKSYVFFLTWYINLFFVGL